MAKCVSAGRRETRSDSRGLINWPLEFCCTACRRRLRVSGLSRD